MKIEQQRARNQIIINMSKQGFSQVDISKATGLTQGRICQILKTYEASPDTFFDNKYQGKPPKLDAQQASKLEDLVKKGAEVYGFQGDIWTAARIQMVIKETFDVDYHERHIPKLLKKMRFTLQKPRLVDSRQSPEKVEDWREEQLPAIKKKHWKKNG